MKVVALLLLAVVVSGCGKAEPTLAGGKPVGYWVQALKDPDARLRKKAAFKLGNVGPADATALPALVEALSDPDAHVRSEAILALVKFGPAAKDARPVLAQLRQRDPSVQVRTQAGKALEKLQNGE